MGRWASRCCVRARGERSSAWPVLRLKGQTCGRLPLPTTKGDVVVEVHVLDLQVGNLLPAHPGVQQQADGGRFAPGLQVVTLARLEQPPELVLVEDFGGASGIAGGFMFVMGEVLISPPSAAQLKKLCSPR